MLLAILFLLFLSFRLCLLCFDCLLQPKTKRVLFLLLVISIDLRSFIQLVLAKLKMVTLRVRQPWIDRFKSTIGLAATATFFLTHSYSSSLLFCVPLMLTNGGATGESKNLDRCYYCCWCWLVLFFFLVWLCVSFFVALFYSVHDNEEQRASEGAKEEEPIGRIASLKFDSSFFFWFKTKRIKPFGDEPQDSSLVFLINSLSKEEG